MTENVTPEAPQPININLQYIKDFSFENPNAPSIFAPTQAAPTLDMGVNVQTHGVGDRTYEVVLNLKVEAKIEGRVAFISELSYAGILTVPPMPEEALKFVLMAEAPRHLFPFARSIISGAVREAGFPQLLINPIDFIAMYNQNSDKIVTASNSA